MKRIAVLKKVNGGILAVHKNPDVVNEYRNQLIKYDDESADKYIVYSASYDDVSKHSNVEDLYLINVGNVLVPSCLASAQRSLTDDVCGIYKNAISTLYKFAETTDRRLKPKDIDALTRVICLLESAIEESENTPIDRGILEEVSANLTAMNWQMGKE